MPRSRFDTYRATTRSGVEVHANYTRTGPQAGTASGYARTDPEPGKIVDATIWAKVWNDGRKWAIAPDCNPTYVCVFHTLTEALAALGRWAVAEHAANPRTRTYGRVGCL